jgi:hypothetical protein
VSEAPVMITFSVCIRLNEQLHRAVFEWGQGKLLSRRVTTTRRRVCAASGHRRIVSRGGNHEKDPQRSRVGSDHRPGGVYIAPRLGERRDPTRNTRDGGSIEVQPVLAVAIANGDIESVDR